MVAGYHYFCHFERSEKSKVENRLAFSDSRFLTAFGMTYLAYFSCETASLGKCQQNLEGLEGCDQSLDEAFPNGCLEEAEAC